MPVTPSYPGLYIEELPLSAHSIQAAPTSITVIVGYTHPYKTRAFNEAVRLFSFSDYEREFGGLFVSGLIEPHVPLAVNQFFLNGGSDLYVVGLEASVKNGGGKTPAYNDITPALGASVNTSAGKGILFAPREPTDAIDMKVQFSNLKKTSGSDFNSFDVTIIYGTRVETFRGITVNNTPPDPAKAANLPHARVNKDTSSLVIVVYAMPGTRPPLSYSAVH